MPVLYYKEDYATLEIDHDGDYVLRVAGVGVPRHDIAVVLDDDELDRYREWGEHFVVTMAHRIHREPGKYAERNILGGAPVPTAPMPVAGRRAWWAFFAVSAALALYILLVVSAVDRPGGEGESVAGMAVGLHSAPDDVGDVYYMTVRLADGDRVQVRVSGRADYKENASLLLVASRPSFFGKRSYRFIGYRDPVR
ncbi:MAG TPA: hypothetical protein VGK27_02255 [Candidatus Deferrimicrobiaceae bacterium]|jgi:hypothetical protein